MWTYEISTGRIYADSGECIGVGYSGAGPRKNDPTAQGLHGEGPCPEGHYSLLSPRDSTEHGPFAIPLLPDAETRIAMLNLNRDPDSFLCHGDSIPHPGNASEGCIIQSRDVREQLWDSKDHDLKVVAVIQSET